MVLAVGKEGKGLRDVARRRLQPQRAQPARKLAAAQLAVAVRVHLAQQVDGSHRLLPQDRPQPLRDRHPRRGRSDHRLGALLRLVHARRFEDSIRQDHCRSDDSSHLLQQLLSPGPPALGALVQQQHALHHRAHRILTVGREIEHVLLIVVVLMRHRTRVEALHLPLERQHLAKVLGRLVGHALLERDERCSAARKRDVMRAQPLDVLRGEEGLAHDVGGLAPEAIEAIDDAFD